MSITEETVENNQVIIIDTSYWKTDDKQWVKDRKNSWKDIKVMFDESIDIPRKEVVAIKRYYLSGVLPDFEALSNEYEYHTAPCLFCAIWLHPSLDKSVLTVVRNILVNSDIYRKNPHWNGFYFLFDYLGERASYPYKKKEMCMIPYTNGKNKLILEVMLGDIAIDNLPENDKYSEIKKSDYISTETIYHHTKWLSNKWLSNKKLNYINDDCIYQYELFSEYWYVNSCKKMNSYTKNYQLKMIVEGFIRIDLFDVETEGDTARSRFVLNMKNVLNNRDFASNLKEIWLDVKSRKLTMDNIMDKYMLKEEGDR
jgi:hypothetical protein